MWGCSGYSWTPAELPLVFPTHVGMFLVPSLLRMVNICFPHACGDVPRLANDLHIPVVFSPRMWGCSAGRAGTYARPRVFPTHVGMFRRRRDRKTADMRFPHACGDVPMRRCSVRHADVFSPRMWGCSAPTTPGRDRRSVFPTHVGMFRGKNRLN